MSETSPSGRAGPSGLCIVTAAMFLTAREQDRLLEVGDQDKVFFYQAKKKASFRAMKMWAEDSGVDVYCVVNGGSNQDLKELREFGVRVDDRRHDLAGKPALQRQVAFRLAEQTFRPAGMPAASRLFLWTEPDKYYLSTSILRAVAVAAARQDLTIVNRSQALFASYNRKQAEMEQLSNRVLNKKFCTAHSRAEMKPPCDSFDFMHGPRVFRGKAIELPINLQIAVNDPMEMYGILNKPPFVAIADRRSLGVVEIGARYPDKLREVDDRIALGYREKQNSGIVANVSQWLESEIPSR